MDWKYYLPVLLVIGSNVIYHNMSKNTPANANPMLSLTITYLVAAVVAGGFYIVMGLTGHAGGIAADIHQMNWTSVLLGVAIVGLELGYILMYRQGWQISKGSLIANVSVAVILLLIGAAAYKESLSVRQYAGILLCIGGLVLVNF